MEGGIAQANQGRFLGNLSSQPINLNTIFYHKDSINFLLVANNLRRYCANEILTCTPALVSTVGADDEMYGSTLR